MKMLQSLLLVSLAALLAGCANTAYIEAQKLAIQADANARVAQAQADAARWTAVAQAANKLDASGAAAVATSAQWSEAFAKANQANQRPLVIERPRDLLDYAEGVARVIGSAGNAVAVVTNIREANKTQRSSYERDIRLEEARQSGETARSNGRPPTYTYAFDVKGDSNFGSGTLDKSDRRDCRSTAGSGGAGAAAASPINFGNLTSGAGPQSLASLISAAAASGGQGGQAMGNC